MIVIMLLFFVMVGLVGGFMMSQLPGAIRRQQANSKNIWHFQPLYGSQSDDSREQVKPKRAIVKYDNVGDPVYADELEGRGGGLGGLDPIALTALVFGAIAFNFFVLANL